MDHSLTVCDNGQVTMTLTDTVCESFQFESRSGAVRRPNTTGASCGTHISDSRLTMTPERSRPSCRRDPHPVRVVPPQRPLPIPLRRSPSQRGKLLNFGLKARGTCWHACTSAGPRDRAGSRWRRSSAGPGGRTSRQSPISQVTDDLREQSWMPNLCGFAASRPSTNEQEPPMVPVKIIKSINSFAPSRYPTRLSPRSGYSPRPLPPTSFCSRRASVRY